MRQGIWMGAALGLVLGVACGARTELFAGDDEAGGAGGIPADAGPDARPDAPLDAPPDVPEDALPDCDPDALFVYLVTSERDLYRFNPDTLEFSLRGTLACPSDGDPFSMGVNRKGRAYVLYNDSRLYKVRVDNAACEDTDFEPGQNGFDFFGMGYALDGSEEGERLYVAEISFQNPSEGLGRIDPSTLELEFINPFNPVLGNSIELTSADDGELYGYFISPAGDGGWVVRIDKESGDILDQTKLNAGGGGGASALAFAYWGGDFYVFTSADGTQTTVVTRYRPSDGTETVITTLNRTVVGAGVSTCKPDGT